MSRTTDLFIDLPSEGDLLSHLERATHQLPEEHGDGKWTVRLTEALTAELRRHDPTRPVPGFGWDLRGRSSGEGPSHADRMTIAMRSLGDDLRAAGCRVLVVHDIQHRPGAVGCAPPAPAAAPAPSGPGAWDDDDDGSGYGAGDGAGSSDGARGGADAGAPDGGGAGADASPDGLDGPDGPDGSPDGGRGGAGAAAPTLAG